MFLYKIHQKLSIFLAGFSVAFPSAVMAQTVLSPSSLSSRLPISWDFAPPDNIDQPDYREAGATRGPGENSGTCLKTNQNFTALVPQSGKGLTAQAYPTFFWHLPSNSGKKLRFTLRNEEGMELYSSEYYLLNKKSDSRIMSFTLPINSGISPLEIGQEYHWELALICNDYNDFDFTLIQASVARVSAESVLSSQAENTTLENQVKLYADARLWYETLETMVELRRLKPNNRELEEAWTLLLSSVGLENIK
jgi:Domain of Unknown Function (DUF928)